MSIVASEPASPRISRWVVALWVMVAFVLLVRMDEQTLRWSGDPIAHASVGDSPSGMIRRVPHLHKRVATGHVDDVCESDVELNVAAPCQDVGSWVDARHVTFVARSLDIAQPRGPPT